MRRWSQGTHGSVPVPSSQGWVKVSPGKWRAGLRKGLEQTSLWKAVEAPSQPVHGMYPLCLSPCQGGGHELLQPLLLVPHAPAQRWGKPHHLHLPSFLPGEKHKSKVITSGLDYSRTKEGRALPRQWALLTPAPPR